MGPMLYTGLASFGATVALGLIAAGTVRTTASPGWSRGTAIVLMAFVFGIATLGVVVGIAAIFAGEVSAPSDALLATALAIAGSVIGIVVMARRAGRLDRGIAALGTACMVGIVTLSIVLVLLLVAFDQGVVVAIGVPPLVALGIISGLSALAIGVLGAHGLAVLTTVDAQSAGAIRAQLLRQCTLLLGVAVISGVLAILDTSVH